MSLLRLDRLHKSFNGQPVLTDISLEITEGQTVVLLGPSGCGKTTLLRLIAGLETADSGHIWFRGEDLSQRPVHQRGFGYLFQDYALFPHKNVAANVAFGLRMQGWPVEKQRPRVAELLALVGLPGFDHRPIHELSGGEQQRVALARALAPAPRLLLLDEPIGALDRALRERLLGELRSILKQAGTAVGQPVTAIYVTHDQEEAFALADELVVMNRGRIEQQGPPLELYRRPQSPFVARFLGMSNIFSGTWQADGQVQTPLGLLQTASWGAIGDPVTLLIRPEGAQVMPLDKDVPNGVRGRVVDISFRGRSQLLTLAFPDYTQSIQFNLDISIPLPPIDSPIHLWIDPLACWPLDTKTRN
ncbi:MAG: ABC transporter ATP-binding protein [Anaerolineae bacterium]|nr:ABC transporter ATP-binding protein [Anaerolineae bacterium]